MATRSSRKKKLALPGRFVRRVINPDEARKMLNRAIHNRRLSRPHVRKLATHMKNGTFCAAIGDAIRFNDKGQMVDGQHRLAAIIESGATLEFYVYFGVPEGKEVHIDGGKGRKLQDRLTMFYKVGNSQKVASGLRMWWAALNASSFDAGSQSKADDAEMLALFELNRGLEDSADATRTHKMPTKPGTSCFLHYAFSHVDHDFATDFFTKLASGIGLQGNSSIYHLRERLHEESSRSRMTQYRVSRDLEVALVIKAWNRFVQGRNMQKLVVTPREPYPRIEGMDGEDVFKKLMPVRKMRPDEEE